MTVDSRWATAWVGRSGVGIGVEILRGTLDLVGRWDAPGFQTAAGFALSWYLDLCLPGRPGVPMVTALASDKWLDLKEFHPNKSFDDRVQDVQRQPELAYAHWVVGHIRHLSERQPNPEHVGQAPQHLRRRMGPDDTWVTGHVREGWNVVGLERLTRTAATADALSAAPGPRWRT